jgi:DNA-binding NarL/FixJ family response regulator
MSVVIAKAEGDPRIILGIGSQDDGVKSSIPPLYSHSAARQNEIFPGEMSRRGREGQPERVGLRRIAVIEGPVFLRECIRRGMQATLLHDFDTFATVEDFERDPSAPLIHLVVLACTAADEKETDGARASIERLTSRFPHISIVVLASRQDSELIGATLGAGAKGFIPMSMGFDIAVEAVRFVLAGGIYFPPEFLMAPPSPGAPPARESRTIRPAITAREMLVMRSIQQGKPNKIIAYELNMSESTVKVHVRHLMKKMGASNRTAVAMKSKELLGAASEAR